MTNSQSKIKKNKNKGFTLLELLIVIAIIAMLAAFLIWVLNPAEVLRRGRDSQRLSDLNTLKRTLGFYMLEVKKSSFGSPEKCEDNWDPIFGEPSGGGKIWLSARVSFWVPLDNHPDPTGAWDGSSSMGGETPCDDALPVDNTLWGQRPCSNAKARKIDGTGWIPIDLTQMTSGSPISALPLDPVNKADPPGEGIKSDDLLYRYTCKAKNTGYVCPADTWEINTVLESEEHKPKMESDGGDNIAYYETGTCLFLLPSCLAPCPSDDDGRKFQEFYNYRSRTSTTFIYARDSPIGKVYLWGAEWWRWLVLQGDDEIWDEVKELF